VKFAPDAGFNHHFVSLGEEINPQRTQLGAQVFVREPLEHRHRADSVDARRRPQRSPARHLNFYTYWPEMRSAGRMAKLSTTTERLIMEQFRAQDLWPCLVVIPVEIMVKMNSSPDSSTVNRPSGSTETARAFRAGTMNGKGTGRVHVIPRRALRGFRWSADLRAKVNKLWLSHYVSGERLPQTDGYAAAHPEFVVNTRTQTVWFSSVVAATEYIGPLKGGGPGGGGNRSLREGVVNAAANKPHRTGRARSKHWPEGSLISIYGENLAPRVCSFEREPARSCAVFVYRPASEMRGCHRLGPDKRHQRRREQAGSRYRW
jgi:hypothetical protein